VGEMKHIVSDLAKVSNIEDLNLCVQRLKVLFKSGFSEYSLEDMQSVGLISGLIVQYFEEVYHYSPGSTDWRDFLVALIDPLIPDMSLTDVFQGLGMFPSLLIKELVSRHPQRSELYEIYFFASARELRRSELNKKSASKQSVLDEFKKSLEILRSDEMKMKIDEITETWNESMDTIKETFLSKISARLKDEIEAARAEVNRIQESLLLNPSYTSSETHETIESWLEKLDDLSIPIVEDRPSLKIDLSIKKEGPEIQKIDKTYETANLDREKNKQLKETLSSGHNVSSWKEAHVQHQAGVFTPDEAPEDERVTIDVPESPILSDTAVPNETSPILPVQPSLPAKDHYDPTSVISSIRDKHKTGSAI
jgi:hypothetical protein